MTIPDHDLTYLAEQLGQLPGEPPFVLMEALARHRSPIVREGAVYGIALHRDRMRSLLESMAVSDASDGGTDRCA